MKWCKETNRMLSVMEVPYIEKKKKGVVYYMRRLCRIFTRNIVYV